MKFKILIFILITLINGCSNQVLTEKEIENKTPIILFVTWIILLLFSNKMGKNKGEWRWNDYYKTF